MSGQGRWLRLRAAPALVLDLGGVRSQARYFVGPQFRDSNPFFLLDAGQTQACSFWYYGLSYSFSKPPPGHDMAEVHVSLTQAVWPFVSFSPSAEIYYLPSIFLLNPNKTVLELENKMISQRHF